MKDGIIKIAKELEQGTITEAEAQKQLCVLFGVSVSLPFISKGKWVFERSSGYSGYRCQECYTWVYENQEKKCDCDSCNEC